MDSCSGELRAALVATGALRARRVQQRGWLREGLHAGVEGQRRLQAPFRDGGYAANATKSSADVLLADQGADNAGLADLVGVREVRHLRMPSATASTALAVTACPSMAFVLEQTLCMSSTAATGMDTAAMRHLLPISVGR